MVRVWGWDLNRGTKQEEEEEGDDLRSISHPSLSNSKQPTTTAQRSGGRRALYMDDKKDPPWVILAGFSLRKKRVPQPTGRAAPT